MKRETLKALRQSIKKWEAIVAGTGKDYGSANCALCQRFLEGQKNYNCTKDDGEECPVQKVTGRIFCMGTPYEIFQIFSNFVGKGGVSEMVDNESAIAAVLELEFLKSLLPEEK